MRGKAIGMAADRRAMIAGRRAASERRGTFPPLLTMQPTLLILIAMAADHLARIGQHFHVIYAPPAPSATQPSRAMAMPCAWC